MMPDPASPHPAPVSPARCNCQVLRQAARRATAVYDGAMAPFGLRISQFAVLSRLRKGGPQAMQELAAALLLDRTTLGRNLRPLERDGLIASATDPADRRVRRLHLTPAGEAMLERTMPAWQEAQAQFEARFGPAESAALRAELQRLVRDVPVPAGAVPPE